MATEIKAIETTYKGYRFRSRLEARWTVFFDTLGIPWEYEKEGYELPFDEANVSEAITWIPEWQEHYLSDQTLYYLPDFWLPKHKYWIEIKGTKATRKDEEKLARLVNATGQHGFIFTGQITLPHENDNSGGYPWAMSGDMFSPMYGGDHPYLWCECPDCGNVGLEFDGRADRLDCKACYYCEDYRLTLIDAAKGPRDGYWWNEKTQIWESGNHTPIAKPCREHGTTHNGGCPRYGGNLDKGYNYDTPRLITAYAAARSARFEYSERR